MFIHSFNSMSTEASVSESEDGGKRKRKAQTRKPRPQVTLPNDLAALTDKDWDKFNLAMDTDPNTASRTRGQTFLCAMSVTIPAADDSPEHTYDLTKLTSDQQKRIASNVGIRGCGSATTFTIRMKIGSHIGMIRGTLDKEGEVVTDEQRHINSVFRLINICFSNSFVHDFITVNDIKKRADHEFGTTHKHFWIRVADAHATSEEQDDDIDKVIYDISHNEEENTKLREVTKDVDPSTVINAGVTTQYCKTKIDDLFRVRRRITKNMTTSGTHESLVWNFVHAAMSSERVTAGMSDAAIYYFYIRCNEHKEIDTSFCPFMDASLKGSSADIGATKSGDDHSGSEKKRAATAIMQMQETSADILEALKEGNATRAKLQQTVSSDVAFNRYTKMMAMMGDPSLPVQLKSSIQKKMDALEKEHQFFGVEGTMDETSSDV